MQTSLARRQRHRRNGASRRPRGGGAIRGIAVAIPLVLFGSLFLVGFVAFVGTVSAYSYYSRDLPDPKALLEKLRFDQQTTIHDRTGTVELARLGVAKREVVTFEDIPPEVIDATTVIEDTSFWENAGFDPFAIIKAGFEAASGGRERGASTITQQLVRARLLPESAFEGSVYERKIREIIQSIRLTQEFPGENGKRQIMAAYLNQNFYGNQSYGVKAAALSYFGKELDQLTLAEAAILAAIPQSPTRFDLVRNAEERCLVDLEEDQDCPYDQVRLVVPKSAEVVRRRDHILERMKTFSVLSAGKHSRLEFERAKGEPVVLVDQRRAPWKAPHLVWQVRQQLAGILCPGDPVDTCEAVDTGGYRVTTSLDYNLQQIAEKWVYAAARVPHLKDAAAQLESLGIPKADREWILNLRGKNIHNGAAAIIDYRTGQILAYVGSASYTGKGTPQFQPQYDVLTDGLRQPGSAIKPLNYIIGIDDRTMTAATMFMDVTTDFGKKFIPTQADGLERGPVRLRSALQFSFNIPSIKAGLINGLDHFFARTKDFGLRYGPKAIPVTSMGIGTLEIHPIDLLGAYGAIANGGVLMPQTMVLSVVDADGKRVWPNGEGAPKGKRVASAEASYVITDILAGNTQPKVNPYWAKWAITDGKDRRPAAYKTGTTNDNKDVHAYGYLAPPADPESPALAAGVWMGNSNNEPNTDTLSLGSSAPLWSAILREASAGLPIVDFADSQPPGLVTAEVDAISGLLPGPFTTVTVRELFIDGTVPTRRDDLRVPLDIDEASGLLWQEGCIGPMVTRGYLNFANVEPAFPEWGEYTRGWVARAAQGYGVRGGPKGTRTAWMYNRSFAPFGAGWGGSFAPTETCTPPPPEPSPEPCDAELGLPCESPTPRPSPPGQSTPPGQGPKSPKPQPRRRRMADPTGSRSSPRRHPRLAHLAGQP